MKYILIQFFIIFSCIAQAKEAVSLPFTFLNQHFEYSVDNTQNVVIANKDFQWSKEFIRFQDNKLLISSNNFLKTSIWNVYFKNKIDKTVLNIKGVNLDQDYKSEVLSNDLIRDTEVVCLAASNRYTQAMICKKISNQNSESTNQFPVVSINEKASTLVGSIILTHPKEKITLRISLGERDFIQVTTRKRQIIPSEIEKDSSNEMYEIKFYDLEDKLFSWKENISFDQEKFNIQNDKIISVQQDFFNKDYSKKDLKITYYKPPVPKKKINNMYQVSPFLGFGNLVGNTSNQNVNLQSELGFGVRGYYNYEFDKENRYLKSLSYFDFMSFVASFKKLQYISSINSYSINNENPFLYQLSAGLSVVYNQDLYYGFGLNINKEDSLAKDVSSQVINVSSVLNIDIGGYAHYLLYAKNKIQSHVLAGAGLLLPAQYSGESTSLGTRFFTEFQVGYRDLNTLYSFGLNYGYRQQETSSQKIKSQTFDYTLGYAVYF